MPSLPRHQVPVWCAEEAGRLESRGASAPVPGKVSPALVAARGSQGRKAPRRTKTRGWERRGERRGPAVPGPRPLLRSGASEARGRGVKDLGLEAALAARAPSSEEWAPRATAFCTGPPSGAGAESVYSRVANCRPVCAPPRFSNTPEGGANIHARNLRTRLRGALRGRIPNQRGLVTFGIQCQGMMSSRPAPHRGATAGLLLRTSGAGLRPLRPRPGGSEAMEPS